jgi:hypothetical protein
MIAFGNEELDAAPALGAKYRCHRCGELHDVIDSNPPGMLQAVRCGTDSLLVGIKWRTLPLPKDKP